MLLRALRSVFLGTVFSLGWIAPATAADVLDQPRALCDYFESLGMKTQFRWGPAPRGNAYVCQYADEFGGNTPFVRGGHVYVDPDSGKVGIALSLQGFQLVRAEAIDEMKAYATKFFQARGQAMPAGLAEAIAGDGDESRNVGGLELSGYGADTWQKQKAVGFTLSRKASAALLASLKQSVTPAERGREAQVRDALVARCRKAAGDSGHSVDAAKLKSAVTPLSASRILVKLSDNLGEFSCQVCDDTDPGVNCGTMGLRLSHKGADGESINLPAELGRKCEYTLQKEISTAKDGSFIDHALVARIKTREVPNDKRYVFEHEVDGQTYRCVIRKSDLNFTLERRIGEDKWRGLVGGVML
jgi:hypothetical protein